MSIYIEDTALKNKLAELYDPREATKITELAFEYITNMSRVEMARGRYRSMTELEKEKLVILTEKLLTHCPIQYAINESWFGGLKIFVDNNVLIPRPETEELVELISKDKAIALENSKSFKILDIGTGSGCISILLRKKLFRAEITSIDVSESALTVAKKNSDTYRANLLLKKIDILDEKQWETLDVYDVIVSNPPYVMEKEKEAMSKNVLNFEPSIALFVPDKDPLLFYKKIASFGITHLAPNGHIYVEINEALGKETSSMFKAAGYNAEIKKDLQGKDRMIKARKL